MKRIDFSIKSLIILIASLILLLPNSLVFADGLIVTPEGIGDVLIFPYYDVRNLDGKKQDTLFAIINECTDSDDQGIVAKLRFREWDKGEEVFDATIWLSKCDVWIGVLTLNETTGLARITSPDHVVVAYSETQFFVQKMLSSGFDFDSSNITFTLPSGWTKNGMTRLGYFEVIGEEKTTARIKTGSTDEVVRLTGYPDCPNVLMGQANIMRVVDGVSMGYNAVAIANFSVTKGTLYSDRAEFPQLSDAEEGLQQLEFELSKEAIFGAYSNETSIAAKASLIINFPTKHFHYSATRDILVAANNPFRGFKENDGEIIDDIVIFDRNENYYKPYAPFILPPKRKLPYELNICGLYQGPDHAPIPSGRDNVAFGTSTFDSGWVWVMFKDHGATPLRQPNGQTLFQHFGKSFHEYWGLPAVGLQLQEFSNYNVGGFYGDINDAWYKWKWFE